MWSGGEFGHCSTYNKPEIHNSARFQVYCVDEQDHIVHPRLIILPPPSTTHINDTLCQIQSTAYVLETKPEAALTIRKHTEGSHRIK